jgi:hypothetical protein
VLTLHWKPKHSSQRWLPESTRTSFTMAPYFSSLPAPSEPHAPLFPIMVSTNRSIGSLSGERGGTGKGRRVASTTGAAAAQQLRTMHTHAKSPPGVHHLAQVLSGCSSSGTAGG